MAEALRLAELFEIEADLESLYRQAAAELRRLHAENERLAAALASSCDEQRYELWESGGVAGCERARVAERQRDALLEALIKCRDRFFPADQPERDRDELWEPVNAAIKAVEGEKT